MEQKSKKKRERGRGREREQYSQNLKRITSHAVISQSIDFRMCCIVKQEERKTIC